MDQIGYHTQVGIQLAQARRSTEALAYLRHAVMTEAVNAEVWLWLAHVSPDLAEYRNCVYQALALDPHHPTALRMQQDLDYQAYGQPPPLFASEAAHTLQQPHHRQKRLRRVILWVYLIMVVALCALFWQRLPADLGSENLNALLPFEAQQKGVQFAVGDAENSYAFSATLPASWYLADAGSSSWAEQRAALQATFPPPPGEVNIWDEFESDWGTVSRDEETGDFDQAIALVETDQAQVGEFYPFLAYAELTAIRDVPPPYQDNQCESLRLMAGDEARTAAGLEGFLGAEVQQRDSDCVLLSQYEDASQETPVRLLVIQIPVGQTQVAVWEVQVPAAQYEDYAEALQNLVTSLRYIPPTSTRG
jgi:hypothetical protein